VQEIARKLHVRSLLEGSVRFEGNHVRVTAQLINAGDGFDIWSQSFDRDMTNVLALQDEISGAIIEALTHALHVNFPVRSSIDAEAYRLVLQAEALVRHGNQDELEKALTLLHSAIARQPDYAEAQAEVCFVQTTLLDRYNKLEYRVPAETACRQAISLDPKDLTALSTLTSLLLDRWEWNEALDVYRKTEALNPNSADVLHLRSVLAYTFNFPEEDIKAELKAAEIDPLRAGTRYDIALWYTYQNRFDEAAAAIEQVLRMRKGKNQDLDQQCAIEAGRRNFAATDRIAKELATYWAESPQNAMNCLFYTAIARRDFALARKLTDAAAADAAVNGGGFQTIGDAYRQLGDLKAAMPWFERDYTERDTLLILTPFEKWQTSALLSYPPWKALWARPPIRAWERARLDVAKILGVKP
jgi:tetratricopeptide (TPR) repeat protein